MLRPIIGVFATQPPQVLLTACLDEVVAVAGNNAIVYCPDKTNIELAAYEDRKVVMQKHLLTAIWGPAHEHDVQYLRVFVGQLR